MFLVCSSFAWIARNHSLQRVMTRLTNAWDLWYVHSTSALCSCKTTKRTLKAHNPLDCAFSWLYLDRNWTLSTSTFLCCVFRLKKCTFPALSTQLTQLQLFSQLFQSGWGGLQLNQNWTLSTWTLSQLFCGWQSGLQLNQNWTLSTWT